MKCNIKYILFIIPILFLAGVVYSFAQKNDDDQASDQTVMNDADNEWNALEKQGNVTSSDQIREPGNVEIPQGPTRTQVYSQQGKITPASQDQVSASVGPQGATPTHDSGTNDSDFFKEFQYQLGVESSFLEYQEPSLQVREKGPYFGAYGSIEDRPPDAQSWPINVIHFDAYADYGDVNYKSPSGHLPGINDLMLEPRLWIGSDMMPFKDTRLTPYLGVGYRLLDDYLDKYSDIGGYNRISQYYYLPMGIEILNESVAGWEFGFTGEYDFFLAGRQESYLSNISSVLPNVVNKQSHGFGLKASIDIIKKMNTVDLVFSPYVRFWRVQQSNTAIAPLKDGSNFAIEGYEPKNSSTEVGLKVGVKF